MTAYYDIAMLADLRFPGGTSTAIASELWAAGETGWKTAILPIKGPLLTAPDSVHPQIAAAVAAGKAEIIDPTSKIEAGAFIIHNPKILARLPDEGINVRATHSLMIAHHPPFNTKGAANYDLPQVSQNAQTVANNEVLWAPVGPIVRTQLENADIGGLKLIDHDWVNILNPEPWISTRPTPSFHEKIRRPVRIGRHSRPDPLKWPADRESVLRAYPDDIDFKVHVLGGGEILKQLMKGKIPLNWHVAPYDPLAAPRFLSNIDFFVYYHHPDWVEAFGRTIIEAMAARIPVILPPHFKPLFGDAAIYATLDTARDTVLNANNNPKLCDDLVETAYTALRERFSPNIHVERIKRLIGRPRR
ncbi:MAG: glycosyltransferase [Pseudomonadota bacterium]